ncbi:DUF4118 domain-containing protein [[Eubacterium] hominis]|uniref:DUF4118 domain-containing protein n=1 Tax=[Eubacterium] hominis TaxID=2764325 RepID=UPI003A4D366B
MKQGHLKIFFGYCAGVGKTYAMLEAAHEREREGIDVVIGYIEKHDRIDTIAQMKGLKSIPLKTVTYHGITLEEFDLDQALQRHPQLILVDELAHTNARGSRHLKRYSDIQELLHAGIDVYTTVNVQHLESLQDVVAGITRVQVQERIPDTVFDDADQVELVDIEPDELIERLKKGKIYQKMAAQKALHNFFVRDNLIALREIALRRCADRVNKRVSLKDRKSTREHILLCLSPSQSNAKVIRTAARMASAFFAEFTALYVESGNEEMLSREDMEQLEQNRRLAQRFHANIVSVVGDDVAQQISEYAKISGVSKIVIGRSSPRPHSRAKTIIDQLALLAPDLEIYIIPDTHVESMKKKKLNWKLCSTFDHRDLYITVFLFFTATGINLLMFYFQLPESNIIMVYLLAIVLISYSTSSRVYGLSVSLLIVVLFNFFFTVPRFSLEAYDPAYAMTFAVLFIVSFIISTLTRTMRMQLRVNAMQAHRMELLLETSQQLQLAENMVQLAEEAIRQLYKLLKRTIIIYSVKNGKLQDPVIYHEQLCEEEEQRFLSENERAVAQWVLKNNRKAGVSTSTLPYANAVYYSIRKKEQVYAVVGIALKQKEVLSPFERSMLATMLNEIALAMDSMRKQNHRKQYNNKL